MKLNSPITVNVQGSSIIIEELDLAILDRPSIKHVTAKVHPLAKTFVLWRGQQYDEAGDYTQAQVEHRIKELLGEDLEGLQSLFNLEIIEE
jgi:hypothetical protein